MKKSVSWSKDLEKIIIYDQIETLENPLTNKDKFKIKMKFSWSDIINLVKEITWCINPKLKYQSDEYSDEFFIMG